jgi:O-acetyl-ADP-ribose deacetylase (regulator of RNase III)
LSVDAIVNAANSGLWGGAGVCGAIFKAAGYQQLTAECNAIIRQYGHISTGQTVLTSSCNLSKMKMKMNNNVHKQKQNQKQPKERQIRYILHTVGPTTDNRRLLYSCYCSTLTLCVEHNIRSVAFPCVSTGVFGFSKENACQTALRAVQQWLIKARTINYSQFRMRKQIKNANVQASDLASSDLTLFDMIDDIIFCCFDADNWQIYRKFTPMTFPSSYAKHSYLWSFRENRHALQKQQQQQQQKQNRNRKNQSK